MPIPRTKAQVASEMLEDLDENNIRGFMDQVRISHEVGLDLNQQYGRESGFKTILHLALEEDDGEPYVDELLEQGAKANFFNAKVGCAPIHVAASEAVPDIFRLLFKYPNNKADVNIANKEGLTAFHILLAHLIDLASLENRPLESRGNNQPTDEEIDYSMINSLECMRLILVQNNLKLDFDKALDVTAEKTSNVKSKMTMKKLKTMTPLQLLCSFQTWNAKPIAENLHDKLQEVVHVMLSRGVDPNATATKGQLAGTVPGSTPSVLLAATRGYYKVVQVFKKYNKTNFLIENKFKQTILHIILKTGYYNKIVVHGEESGEVSIRTLLTLFDEENLLVQQEMKSIINRLDSYENTALHYAKAYPNQSVVKLMLRMGAKIDRNAQGILNLMPRTLEEYFYESCIIPEGDDIDDEEFKIRINFKIFEKPLIGGSEELAQVKEKSDAWTLEMEKGLDKKAKDRLKDPPSSGRVDTKRLEYFSEVDGLHYLLKHPVVTSFLEMELNSLRSVYLLDFLVYFIFVLILFIFFSDKYGLTRGVRSTKTVLFEEEEINYRFTYPLVFLCIMLALLIVREIWQMVRLRKRYFLQVENYIEWTVIFLVLLDIMPWYNVTELADEQLQRHLAAFILLISFMQLYLLLVRVVPNTPIPLYINMFTTVLKTYTLILLSYLAFILSFAYSFYLIFGPITLKKKSSGDDAAATAVTAAGGANSTTAATPTTTTEGINRMGDEQFANLGLSIVKTLAMFVGEMDYNDIMFRHWSGYIIFTLFIFLLIIVLMNILNGLAVSDIHKIREEVDTYYHISIVESLAYTNFVTLLADEVVLCPNIRPERQKFLGITMPAGNKIYRAKGGPLNQEAAKDFNFSENTVKSAKELIAQKQQQHQSLAKVSLETIDERIGDLGKEQGLLKQRLAGLEEKMKLLLDIMVSRQPPVERH